ncbi:calx-beta domain protein, partial [Vibrio harveyi]
KTSR